MYKRGKIWWASFPRAEGGTRFRSTGTSNKRLAQKIEAKWRAEAAEGRTPVPAGRSPKLESWSEQFLETITHKRTWHRYRASIRNLQTHFRNVRLSQITVRGIETYKKSRLEKGIGPATINRDLAVLRRMLRLAKRQRLIGYSPFEDGVDFLRESHCRRQAKILSFAEEEKLLTVATPLLRVLVVLLLETGLRVNKEALALLWQDVDFLEDVILVRESKTVAGRRTVPLSEYCKAELLRWKELNGNPGSGYVFPNPRSSTGHLRVVRKMWGTALRLAGIPYFRIYDLRATFASRLSAAGTPDNFISQMLGHAGSGILQTYSRAIDQYRRDAISRLQALRESKAPAKAPAKSLNQIM